MTEDIPYSQRFVANSDTRKRMARAFLGHDHRTKAAWVGYSIGLAVFTLLLMPPESGTGVRLLVQLGTTLVLALLSTLMVAVFLSTVRYFAIIRQSRFTLFSGAVLESGFGEDEMAAPQPPRLVSLTRESSR